MNRRGFLRGTVAGAAVLALQPAFAVPKAATAPLAALERARGGRLGVAILDTGSGQRVAHRGDERFLMCSTFKLLLVAEVLKRVDGGNERLERDIVFGKDALLDWAPATQRHVGSPGMTIAGLCEAAITLSDNTAANLLLANVGGPASVTACARSLGDAVTRLDRIEPALNRPDGDKDTTTPWSMLSDMHELLLGEALSAASRSLLTGWLKACQTGLDALRAELPAGWHAGDKTGSNHAANNDIAILWPPERKPILVTAYYDNRRTSDRARKAVLADVGRIVARL